MDQHLKDSLGESVTSTGGRIKPETKSVRAHGGVLCTNGVYGMFQN